MGLSEAIERVLNSADNTGCSDDLTVVSQEAIEQLEQAYREVFGGSSPTLTEEG